MTDPHGQPSPEELEAYVEQLRSADVAELVVQTFNMLASGAQVKLGRPDARVLIDVLVALVSTVEGNVDGRIVEQMRTGVSQLQMAQVQAENEAGGGAGVPGQAAAAGAGRGAGAPGAPGGPGAPAGGGRPQEQPGQAARGRPGPGQGQSPGAEQRMTDRLWIPGRGPAPNP